MIEHSITKIEINAAINLGIRMDIHNLIYVILTNFDEFMQHYCLGNPTLEI